MAHSYSAHYYVDALMNAVGINSSDVRQKIKIDELEKSNNMSSSTMRSYVVQDKKKIMNHATSASAFLKKYDDLKSKNVSLLDPLVSVLANICDDEQVKLVMKDNTQKLNQSKLMSMDSGLFGSTSSGSSFTTDELEKYAEQVMKRTIEDNYANVQKAPKSKNPNVPDQPEWMSNRPYLTMDYVLTSEVSDVEKITISNLPLREQENLIIEDLLYCMEGVEGEYISPLPRKSPHGEREFLIDPALNISLKELARRILPVCSYYSTVVQFIEEKSKFECGQVNHALSAAMRLIMKDYLVFVAQLEAEFNMGTLNLQKMCYIIQPTIRTFSILASIANAINKGDRMGGSVLTLLHEKTNSLIGDDKSQELCLFLTESACVPYFQMIEQFIYRGVIKDPYFEFFVEESKSHDQDKMITYYPDGYWKNRYKVCRERIPVFLESVSKKICDTGKSFNVVKEWGADMKCPFAEKIVYTQSFTTYFAPIDKVYNYASNLLVDLLKREHLVGRLKSLKHYFLLDQGDFIVQFMDMADDELKKPMSDINPDRLELLLGLSLRVSTANCDPFKDDLKVILLPYDVITQLFTVLSIDSDRQKEFNKENITDEHLTGLEAFSFDYSVQWPISLVMNKSVLVRYQILFRHLFYCKHVERQLCNVWISNKSAKMCDIKSTNHFASAFTLRQQMLNFVQNLEYYMLCEVIEPHWQKFISSFDKVSNVEEIIQNHNVFLSDCLQDCILTNNTLLKIFHNLMMICVTFSNFIKRLNESINVSSTLSSQRQVVVEHLDQMAGSENFERTISNFKSNFSNQLSNLLDNICKNSPNTSSHQDKLINILYRLNFNGFYSSQFDSNLNESDTFVETS